MSDTDVTMQWQGLQVWAGLGSSRRDPLTATYHAATDGLDGRAVCGAFVYEYAGRVGIDQVGTRAGWPETYADGEPMLYRVTCKRCNARLTQDV